MDAPEFDDLLRRLTVLLVKQDGINARLDTAIEELRAFNRQQVALTQPQVAINADMRTTLARVETLLARRLPPAGNGREA